MVVKLKKKKTGKFEIKKIQLKIKNLLLRISPSAKGEIKATTETTQEAFLVNSFERD